MTNSVFMQCVYHVEICLNHLTSCMKSISSFICSLEKKFFFLTILSTWATQLYFGSTYSSWAIYISHTKRFYLQCIFKHSSVWLSRKLQKLVKNSTLEHLVNFSHSASLGVLFNIIHAVRRTNSRRMEYTAEIVAVHHFKPNLCVQKLYVQSFILP